jgi:hypothetical protein
MDIVKMIKEDPEMFYGYQSNIAMAFYDEYLRYKEDHIKKYVNKKDLHIIANDAAENFLNLLIKVTDERREEGV